MRVGIVGIGDTALRYYHSLQSLKGVSHVIFFAEAPSELHMAASSAESNTIITLSEASFDAFLCGVDAVCFCAPLSDTLPLALATADAGVPMLIDISMCSSTADLAELELHTHSAATAGVGNAERFHPAVADAMKRIRDPRYVSVEQSRPAADDSGVSVTASLIAPYLDVLLPALPAGIDSVCAIGGAWVMYALLRSGDVPLYFSVNSMASAPKAILYVEDAEQTIRCDALRETVVLGSRVSCDGRDTERVTSIGPAKTEPVAAMLAEFLRCAADGEAFGVSFARAAELFSVCERIEREAGPGKRSSRGRAGA